MQMTDSDRAKKAALFIAEKYEEPRKAFETAEAEMAQAKVEIGKYLFQEFFENKTDSLGKRKFEPKYKDAFTMLKSQKELPLPLKSKTGLRNLVMLGYQTIWLEEQDEDINIDRMIKDGKLFYTHLVRLDGMDYGDIKVQLVKDMAVREKAFTVSELEDEIKSRLKAEGKTSPTFPPNFDDIMATDWTRKTIEEKIKLVDDDGRDISPERVQKNLDKLLKDIKAAAKHGYDQKQGGIQQARGVQIEKTLRDSATKAKDYLQCINTALKKLEEMKPKKDNLKKAS